VHEVVGHRVEFGTEAVAGPSASCDEPVEQVPAEEPTTTAYPAGRTRSERANLTATTPLSRFTSVKRSFTPKAPMRRRTDESYPAAAATVTIRPCRATFSSSRPPWAPDTLGPRRSSHGACANAATGPSWSTFSMPSPPMWVACGEGSTSCSYGVFPRAMTRPIDSSTATSACGARSWPSRPPSPTGRCCAGSRPTTPTWSCRPTPSPPSCSASSGPGDGSPCPP